tara:strand:+ start:272 stop:553 length:282 start_codon:yes stop_codon:yes gene_type:complete
MSYFYHKQNGVVEIDRIQFDEKIIKQFDPDYNTPEGWSRMYIQNRKHYLSNGKNQVGDKFPWPDGDRYIKSILELKFLEKQLQLDEESNADDG